MLEHGASEFAQVARLIAVSNDAAPTAVLVQKNLAGPWAEGMMHMVTSLGVPVSPALETLVVGTPPEAIEQALDWVDSQHGSAADYLLSGGLTADELTALRTRLGA